MAIQKKLIAHGARKMKMWKIRMKGINDTLPSLRQRETIEVREGSGKEEAIKKQAKGGT